MKDQDLDRLMGLLEDDPERQGSEMSPERRRLALRASGMRLADSPEGAHRAASAMQRIRLGRRARRRGSLRDTPVSRGCLLSREASDHRLIRCGLPVGRHLPAHMSWGTMSTATVGSSMSWWRSVGKTADFDPKEFEADCFASALLMPRTAVLKGLGARGWNSKTLLPEQAICTSIRGSALATERLVSNMHRGMGLLQTLDQAAALEKVKLPANPQIDFGTGMQGTPCCCG